VGMSQHPILFVDNVASPPARHLRIRRVSPRISGPWRLCGQGRLWTLLPMTRAGVRYLSGAAAGACLTAIVVWVVDQLRRSASSSDDEPTGARAARTAAPPRVGDT
jgi:hypothetical protein